MTEPSYVIHIMFVIYKTYYSSPLGPVKITGTEKGILSVHFVDQTMGSPDATPGCLMQCIQQLDEYFKGKRKTFALTLQIQGPDFDKKVWSALLDIPYGTTVSYGEIAERIGRPKAYRAVGNANRKNNIGIIIPCHRVIGSNGKLTGYADGLWRKKWLLEHEKKML